MTVTMKRSNKPRASSWKLSAEVLTGALLLPKQRGGGGQLSSSSLHSVRSSSPTSVSGSVGSTNRTHHSHSGDMNRLPNLLMVEMQAADSRDVIDAMETLGETLTKYEEDEQGINEYAQEMFQLGGHAMIILIMRRWANNQRIQEIGCYCLQTLLSHERNATVKTGGIEMIVAAMRSFPNSRAIQACGCSAMHNACLNLDAAPTAVALKVDELVTEWDGINLAVAAMNKFSEDEALQEVCCRFFFQLSLRKGFCRELMKNGSTSTAFLNAYSKFPKNAAIQRCVQETIRRLDVIGNKRNLSSNTKSRLRRSGTV